MNFDVISLLGNSSTTIALFQRKQRRLKNFLHIFAFAAFWQLSRHSYFSLTVLEELSNFCQNLMKSLA